VLKGEGEYIWRGSYSAWRYFGCLGSRSSFLDLTGVYDMRRNMTRAKKFEVLYGVSIEVTKYTIISLYQ
jgi:hypothetical protein